MYSGILKTKIQNYLPEIFHHHYLTLSYRENVIVVAVIAVGIVVEC